MKKYIKHFITITKHKFVVMKWCFRMGIYLRGILHDLSKYSFIEFFSSAKYFCGTSSPIDKEKKAKGYSLAWQNHQNKNKHHWEYWVDWKNGNIYGVKIPFKYVIEMFCDFVGAGKVYSKDKWTIREPLSYFYKVKDNRVYNKETEEFFEDLLLKLSTTGNEKDFFKWFKYNKKQLRKKYEGEKK